MARARLEAPSENGAILAVPSLDEVSGLLVRNRTGLDNWQYDFQGRSAARLRTMTRAAVLAAARDYTGGGQRRAENDGPEVRAQVSSLSGPQPSALNPQPSPPLILTGHQPELFHPGVWVKNFASYSLAKQNAGISLHLVVDNDTVKRTTVRLPTGSIEQPSVVHVPLDRWNGEIPFEEYQVSDEAIFESFGERLESAVRPLGIEPLAREFWPLAIEAGRHTKQLSERIARARRRQEAAWDCHNLELPVSRLCQTEGFYWFACHVLAQLGRFREEYNQALDDYRRRNRIRSQNHPVPALERDGEWIEAPFWIWSDRSPRRRHLFARQDDRELVLTDRDQWTERLPLAPDREACCAVDVLRELPARGIKLRTRALTTTMFTRLCLGDLFIHGIGGAKYDELSDEIIRRFFGLEPPGFLTLTATLHLPVIPRDATLERRRQLERMLRDLEYNPDRHLDPTAQSDPRLAAHIAEKQQVIRTQPQIRAERRRRCEKIRRLNDSLAPAVATTRVSVLRELDEFRADFAANSIVRNREWPFCVYPGGSLLSLFQPLVEIAGTEGREMDSGSF